MTYGVPYSFVPGTKAKADEVNANFIEVLNKIEETNTRIDEANTQSDLDKEALETKLEEKYKELNSSKVALDLSNLNTAGKTVLNNKANVTDIDGKWTKKGVEILREVTLSGNSKAWTYDLTSVLPKDGNVYEVLLQVEAQKSGGNWALYYFGSALCDYLTIISTGSNNVTGFGGFFIPVSKDRKIYIKSSNNGGGSTSFYVNLRAYRKVR